MTEATFLQKAHALAHQAHRGQVDKGGHPYIGHPTRVAFLCADEPGKVVAFLHDVVEDTEWTLEGLTELFPMWVVTAVDAITRRDGEKFWDYIHRCNRHDIARVVKINDIYDNMDVSRVAGTDAEQMIRGMIEKRYKPALKILGA